MGHKHRGSSKIKHQHHIIDGLAVFLERIEDWEEIRSVIPGKINRIRSSMGSLKIRIQYPTVSGLKCLAREAAAVQEVFFVTPKPQDLQDRLKKEPEYDAPGEI